MSLKTLYRSSAFLSVTALFPFSIFSLGGKSRKSLSIAPKRKLKSIEIVNPRGIVFAASYLFVEFRGQYLYLLVCRICSALFILSRFLLSEASLIRSRLELIKFSLVFLSKLSCELLYKLQLPICTSCIKGFVAFFASPSYFPLLHILLL